MCPGGHFGKLDISVRRRALAIRSVDNERSRLKPSTLRGNVSMELGRCYEATAPILLGFDLTISDSLIKRRAAQAQNVRDFGNLESKMRKGLGSSGHGRLRMDLGKRGLRWICVF
jgi:hypothetical protein